MRLALSFLAIFFASACSADKFDTPGVDAGTDAVVADVVVLDAPGLDGGGVDGSTVDASGIPVPQPVKGIPPNIDLFGVWGGQAGDFWVVGGDSATKHGFAAHWTGSAFASFTDVSLAPLRGVAGDGQGVFVAGDQDPNTTYGQTLFYNGNWVAGPQAGILFGRGIVSVGYDSSEIILQTDVAIMARSSSPYTSITGVSQQISAAAGKCYAMDARYAACAGGVFGPGGQAALINDGKARALHVSNKVGPLVLLAGPGGYLAAIQAGTTTPIPSSTAKDLEGIWSSTLGLETLAVGKSGTIVAVKNATTASPQVALITSGTSENLHAVTAMGAGSNRTFVAVGDKGTVLAAQF